MRRKTTYESPSCFCMEICHQQELMLRTSGDQTVVDICDEQAGENVGGLSRRRTVWDDDAEELEEEF